MDGSRPSFWARVTQMHDGQGVFSGHAHCASFGPRSPHSGQRGCGRALCHSDWILRHGALGTRQAAGGKSDQRKRHQAESERGAHFAGFLGLAFLAPITLRSWHRPGTKTLVYGGDHSFSGSGLRQTNPTAATLPHPARAPHFRPTAAPHGPRERRRRRPHSRCGAESEGGGGGGGGAQGGLPARLVPVLPSSLPARTRLRLRLRLKPTASSLLAHRVLPERQELSSPHIDRSRRARAAHPREGRKKPVIPRSSRARLIKSSPSSIDQVAQAVRVRSI